MSEELWHDENEQLSVTIYNDASATILVKSTGVGWNMSRVALQEDGPVDMGHVWLRRTRSVCEEYPGRFRGEQEGDLLRFILLGREMREVGYFTCKARLTGTKFELSIIEIAESISSLVFPPALESESLVFPTNVGRWVRKPLSERHFWVYPTHLNMRWFGGLRGDDGWIAIVDEGYANGGVLTTELSASPAWLKSLGHWSGPRTISYQFVTGGYVGLAKTFRSYAIEKGLHRTLTEKMRSAPALRHLYGSRLLSFMQSMPFHPENYEDRLLPVPTALSTQNTSPIISLSHNELRYVLEQMPAMGLEQALVVVRGWIQGGYDESHPDVWPPEPSLGTMDEFRRLITTADAFPVALHDNYQDMYQGAPSWPHGTNRSPAGNPMPAGFWAGGQAYALNSRNGLAYAQRNWNAIKTLQPAAMFIDTTTAMQFYESYEPGNELSRAQDEAFKIALLRFYKEQGLVLGSEEGADFGVPWVDWIENRHARVAGESIPLWPLVFHDAAFCVRYDPYPYVEPRPDAAPRWLADMLWGYPLLWDLSRRERRQASSTDFAATRHVDAWHGQIGSDDMLTHRYLTEDGEVEETTFSSGATIIVNFAPEERIVQGRTVPGYGYIIH